MVGAYAVCWLPIHVITLIGEADTSFYNNKAVHALWLFAHWLAVCNSTVNPVLVLAKQEKFRRQLALCLGVSGPQRLRRQRVNSGSLTAARVYAEVRQRQSMGAT